MNNTATVPREALSGPHPANTALIDRRPRRYRSPARTAKAMATRKAVIEAALDFMAEGHFRVPSGLITERAGVHRGTINYYWGHETLFYRALAREHWERVAECLPFAATTPERGICDFGGQYAKAAVWAVLVGEPREIS